MVKERGVDNPSAGGVTRLYPVEESSGIGGDLGSSVVPESVDIYKRACNLKPRPCLRLRALYKELVLLNVLSCGLDLPHDVQVIQLKREHSFIAKLDHFRRALRDRLSACAPRAPVTVPMPTPFAVVAPMFSLRDLTVWSFWRN